MKSKKAIKKRIEILKEELKANHAWITKATTIALINELEWVLSDKNKWRRYLVECPQVREIK